MVQKILFIALALLIAPLGAYANVTDSPVTQFTIQATVLDGSPAFIFRAEDIEQCPLRFLHHPGPMELDGRELAGFELSVMQDETCRMRVYRAWGEAYSAMVERGAVKRVFEQALMEFNLAVEACNKLEAELLRKYDGNLEIMDEDDKKEFDKTCQVDPPEAVVNQRLLKEPEALAWKANFKGPMEQVIKLEELRSFFDNRPIVPDEDLQGFKSESYLMRFVFFADNGFDSIRVVSNPITVSDLSPSSLKTIYNRYNPAFPVTSK